MITLLTKHEVTVSVTLGWQDSSACIVLFGSYALYAL